MDAMTIHMTMEHLQSKALLDCGPDDCNGSANGSLEERNGDTEFLDLPDIQNMLDNKSLQSIIQVLSEHESYMSSFLRAHSTLLRGDVPLSVPVRHYVAVMAASQHSCHNLVSAHRTEFLNAGGPPDWLETGLSAVNSKLQKLGKINDILAHQPWTITPSHIEEITRPGGKDNWSLSELVYAIVLMAHFHSFSSFIESCVSVEVGNKIAPPPPSPIHSAAPARPYDCSSPAKGDLERTTSKERRRRKGSTTSTDSCVAAEETSSPPYDCSAPNKVMSSSGSPGTDRVDSLVQKMEQLRAQPEADSEELEARFERVKETSAEIGKLDEQTATQYPLPQFRKFLRTPDFHYVDFAKRDNKQNFPTFRVQDFNWDEEGFSVISRFYDEIAQLLDDKFRTAYNMTYRTMGRLTAIDTSMFRRATWNYIQCLYGVRWDDYDYSEVNVLLHRSLKKYIKTAACYPDRCSTEEYKAIMQDFLPSEKVHVCLLVAEAKFQSELLYALRAIAEHYRT
eukprot:TRINITY_DN12201_c0_g3_i1.p1 TRINITY_DN12201_c0_g3~~TRINITY_DN12201_c0_g3_i1.p1  ORF type:complete len:508 (+),score=92.85 TRINITY_DN12201_c0_g3_i1:90-1613(+)